VSGGIAFDHKKFVALADYLLVKRPMASEDLAWFMFRLDFDAYLQLGKPITGATYLRGEHHPEVREVGIGWFRHFWLARTPRWARIAAAPLTAYVIAKALTAQERSH
jgi:hypothetical protein